MIQEFVYCFEFTNPNAISRVSLLVFNLYFYHNQFRIRICICKLYTFYNDFCLIFGMLEFKAQLVVKHKAHNLIQVISKIQTQLYCDCAAVFLILGFLSPEILRIILNKPSASAISLYYSPFNNWPPLLTVLNNIWISVVWKDRRRWQRYYQRWWRKEIDMKIKLWK